MTHRPCGACRELVPADTGCEHWRPGRSLAADLSRARRRQKQQELKRFRRQMGLE